MTDWDVIVVGGGPAGSASAALFAAQGRRVLLLDSARFPRPKACAEYVSPGGVAILDRLGILSELNAGRWLRGMQVEAPGGECFLVDYRLAKGQQHYGLSVPRLALDAALLDVARQRGVEVRESYRVNGVWRDASRVRGIVGPTGECLSAELVVGADGLRSVVARDTCRRSAPRWPRRLGLVAHFSGVAWPEDHGYLLVGQHGYVGVAPLDERGLVTVGLVRTMPRGRLGSPVAALQAGLAEYRRLNDRLSRGQLASAVIGVGPLATVVNPKAGPGFALVGDAAGFFDPFTGEGIFRALRGAELLTTDPQAYVESRTRAFAAKERLVALVQVFVQTPPLLALALRRLRQRPSVARQLGCMLGDLEPASLGVAWHLLRP